MTPRTRCRRLGAILGAIAAVSTAGCTGDGDEEDSPDPSTADADRDDGDSRGTADRADAVPDADADGDADHEPDRDGPDDGPDETPDEDDDESSLGADDGNDGANEPSEERCSSDELARLEDRRAELELRIEDIRFDHRDELESYHRHRLLRDQLAGEFADETVEAARTVGTRTRDATVVLDILEDGERSGRATGWFVTDSLIVTNAHNVYDGAVRELRAITIDETTFDVMVLGYEEGLSPDLAVLEAVDYRHEDPLDMASEVTLERGQPLVQAGNPGSYGYWVISLGRYVSTQEYLLENDEEYQELTTTVPGREGVSGSPLVTLDGDVVGVTYAGSPLLDREIGRPAPVAPPTVFDIPIDPLMTSHHVAIDTLRPRLERWG